MGSGSALDQLLCLLTEASDMSTFAYMSIVTPFPYRGEVRLVNCTCSVGCTEWVLHGTVAAGGYLRYFDLSYPEVCSPFISELITCH